MADNFGINITGKSVYLWAKDKESPRGNFRLYSISISNKTADGETEYMPVNVRLPKNAPDYHNKTKIDFEGFLSFRSWADKDGKVHKDPIIVMTSVKANEGFSTYDNLDDLADDLNGTAFQAADDEIPF